MSPARANLARVPFLFRGLVLAAFFASGAAALAYEVAWARGLLRLLGSTTLASTLVLGVFVGSLGFGARWGGHRALRSSRPLALYGLLEIGAAVWAVLAFGLTDLLEAPYVALATASGDLVRTLLRGAAAVLVVAPGAFLLGATLPALVRHWVRTAGRGGSGTAVLYGVNTVGAVAGAWLTGFFAIEALGVVGTLRLAAGIGAAVGAAALLASRFTSRLEPSPLPPRAQDVAPFRAVALVAFVGGFIGLGVEVVGLRVLSFFLEGFTVTFAAMLGTFIAGLGVGSLLLGPRLARGDRPHVALGVLFLAEAAALAFAALVVVPALDPMLRDVKAWAYRDAKTAADVAASLRVFALVGSAALLFIPALVWGATFPLVVRWAEREGDAPARAVGRVYLWNSVGSIAAPVYATFLATPARGPLGAWLPFGALCFFGAGALLAHAHLARRGPVAWRLRWGVALSTLLLGVLPGDGTAGFLAKTHLLRAPGRRLLASATDSVTTASAIETGERERILYTDDFPAAATGRHYRYMRMLGHLPVLLAKDPSNALVIAFGTGTTAGAVALHPEVTRLEVAEVSGAVLDLAPWFEAANRKVLADPRVVVHRDDGRNVLLLREPGLGVITLEPLMPYSPAGLPFYTRDFYELARDRLADGGVLCQWVPVHAMPVEMYRALLETFFEVFPDGSLWFFEQSTALIGRKGSGVPLRWPVTAAVEADLHDAGLPDPPTFRSAFVASGRAVLEDGRRRPPARTVTDLDPWPEFHPTPRADLRTPYLEDTLTWLAEVVEDRVPADLAAAGASPSAAEREATRAGLIARGDEARAESLGVLLRGVPAGSRAAKDLTRLMAEALGRAARSYTAALQRLPKEGAWTTRRARTARRAARMEALGMLGLAAAHRQAKRPEEARTALSRALRLAAEAYRLEESDPLDTERAEAAVAWAGLLLRFGRCDDAEKVLEETRTALHDTSREPLLDEAIRAVRAVRAGHDASLSTDLRPWFEDLAPCGPEGVVALKDDIARYRAALAADPRSAAVAAGALEAAARESGEETALVAELRSVEDGALSPGSRAVHAALLDALDGATRVVGLLGAADASQRLAALQEIGRRRSAHYAAQVVALGEDPDPTVRAAALDATSRAHDVSGLRRLASRLMDPVRDVRVAAATALHDLAPELLETFDPDGSEGDRQKVLDALRATFP